MWWNSGVKEFGRVHLLKVDQTENYVRNLLHKLHFCDVYQNFDQNIVKWIKILVKILQSGSKYSRLIPCHYVETAYKWSTCNQTLTKTGSIFDSNRKQKLTLNLAVASDHYDRRATGKQELPTLIVSPPSVTGHWVEEIEKFCGDQLSVLHYTGNNNERRKLQSLVSYNNIIVSSYEVIRNDSTFFHVSLKPRRPVPWIPVAQLVEPLVLRICQTQF